MAKRAPSFNFGANVKPRKPRGGKKGAGKARKGGGRKGSAWRAYVGGGSGRVSNAPLPD